MEAASDVHPDKLRGRHHAAARCLGYAHHTTRPCTGLPACCPPCRTAAWTGGTIFYQGVFYPPTALHPTPPTPFTRAAHRTHAPRHRAHPRTTTGGTHSIMYGMCARLSVPGWPAHPPYSATALHLSTSGRHITRSKIQHLSWSNTRAANAPDSGLSSAVAIRRGSSPWLRLPFKALHHLCAGAALAAATTPVHCTHPHQPEAA